MVENNPAYAVADWPNVDEAFSQVIDRLQELIWKVGEDIGEF